MSKQDQFPSTSHALWPQGWGICNRRGRRERCRNDPTWSFCMRALEPCWQFIVLSKPCPIASNPVGGKGDVLLLPQQGQTDHSATIHCVCTTVYLYGCLHITIIFWMPFCCLNMTVGSPHPNCNCQSSQSWLECLAFPSQAPDPQCAPLANAPSPVSEPLKTHGRFALCETTSALVALCFWFPTSDTVKIAGRKRKITLFLSSVFWVCSILSEKWFIQPSVRKTYLDDARELWEGLHLHTGLSYNLWKSSQLRTMEDRCRYKTWLDKTISWRFPEAEKVLWENSYPKPTLLWQSSLKPATSHKELIMLPALLPHSTDHVLQSTSAPSDHSAAGRTQHTTRWDVALPP